METHLTIKHLAPYLPYGLKMKSDTKILPLIGFQGQLMLLNENTNCVSSMIDETFWLPILHPLSDLTKEIEGITLHKIIPLQKLCRNHAYMEQYSKDWSFGERNGIYFASAVDSIMTRLFEYHSKNKYFILSNPRDNEKLNCNQFYAFNQLFEWHFDVFGLIEQGLAIDINTLQS